MSHKQQLRNSVVVVFKNPSVLHFLTDLVATLSNPSLNEDGGPNADEFDASCECGCELVQPSGQLIAPANHRCNNGGYLPGVAIRRLPIVWRITAEPHRVVQITYRLLAGINGYQDDDEKSGPMDAPVVSTTWVRIRDGLDGASATMLAVAHGGGDGIPRVVTSSTRHVTVEYQAPLENGGGDGGGFMASYVTLGTVNFINFRVFERNALFLYSL